MPDRSPNTTSRLAARLQRRREALRQRPRLYAAIVGIVVAFFAALAWPFTIAHLQSIAVLDLVAEPVQITGEVERQGDLLFLRADPSTYRRLPR